MSLVLTFSKGKQLTDDAEIVYIEHLGQTIFIKVYPHTNGNLKMAIEGPKDFVVKRLSYDKKHKGDIK